MPDDGRTGERRQQPIPLPRKLDRYGLCAHDCECARCNLGFRPSIAERDAARRAYERFEALKQADAAPGGRAAEGKRRKRKAAFAEEERHTDRLIARLTEPVQEPATPEQLAELKKQYPNLNRRRKP